MTFIARHARGASELLLGAVIAAAILWNGDVFTASSTAEAAGPPPTCAPPVQCPDTYECCGGMAYCPGSPE